MVTDPEIKLALTLKLKTQSFPHLRVKKLRVCTKPASWKTPQKRHPAWCLRAWSLFNPPSDRKLLLKPKWTDPSCRFGAVLEGIWPATGQKTSYRPGGLKQERTSTGCSSVNLSSDSFLSLHLIHINPFTASCSSEAATPTDWSISLSINISIALILII